MPRPDEIPPASGGNGGGDTEPKPIDSDEN